MARLEFNEVEQAKHDEAQRLQEQANWLRHEADDSLRERERAEPLADRLVYAAFARCACGLGFAYDPSGEVATDEPSPFQRPNQWECSGILLGTGDRSVEHTPPMSFTCWEVKSENQPSANGATTRPTQGA